MKRFLLAMFVGLVVCFGNSSAQAESLPWTCLCWDEWSLPVTCLSWTGFPGKEVPGTRTEVDDTDILSESGPEYNGQCPSVGATAPKPKCKVTASSRKKYTVSGSVTLANFGFGTGAESEMTSSCETEITLNDWCQCCHLVAKIDYKIVTASFRCECSGFGVVGTCKGTSPVSGSYTKYSHPICGSTDPPCTPPCVKNCPPAG